MKDGATGFAYKAEPAVDLDTEIVVAADVKPAGHPTARPSRTPSSMLRDTPTTRRSRECRSTEVVADKANQKTATLVWLGDRDIRAYVAPRRDKRKRRWDDKPEGWEVAFR